MSEDIEGWPAVAWTAAMGAELLLTSGIVWLRSRSFRDRPEQLPTYRTAASKGSNAGSELRALAILMLLLFALTQLLYIWVYVELAQWALWNARQPPRVSPQLFFWVFLITTTFAGGSLYTAATTKTG